MSASGAEQCRGGVEPAPRDRHGARGVGGAVRDAGRGDPRALGSAGDRSQHRYARAQRRVRAQSARAGGGGRRALRSLREPREQGGAGLRPHATAGVRALGDAATGDVVVTYGHSLWFRAFCQEYFPAAAPHNATRLKLANCGVVSFTLEEFAAPPAAVAKRHFIESAAPRHRIDPTSFLSMR